MTKISAPSESPAPPCPVNGHEGGEGQTGARLKWHNALHHGLRNCQIYQPEASDDDGQAAEAITVPLAMACPTPFHPDQEQFVVADKRTCLPERSLSSCGSATSASLADFADVLNAALPQPGPPNMVSNTVCVRLAAPHLPETIVWAQRQGDGTLIIRLCADGAWLRRLQQDQAKLLSLLSGRGHGVAQLTVTDLDPALLSVT